MENLCPQVTVSSTPKLTSRFKIRVQKDFQAILGEEEDVRRKEEESKRAAYEETQRKNVEASQKKQQKLLKLKI